MRQVEILASLGIGAQARPVALIRRQAVEGDQPPGDVVGAFMRQEIADEMSATARNDAAPVFGVFPERVALEGIDLIADDNRDGHGQQYDACPTPTLRLRSNHGCRPTDGSRSFPGGCGHRRARAHADALCVAGRPSTTSTELAILAGVNPPTASVHLPRLKTARLVKMLAQGKHRYYSLAGIGVARMLEGMSVFAGGTRGKFVPNTPSRLRRRALATITWRARWPWRCTTGFRRWAGFQPNTTSRRRRNESV